MVIAHTGCGLLGADESGMRTRPAEATGETLDFAFGAGDDLEATVRRSIDRIQGHPWTKPPASGEGRGAFMAGSVR